MRRLAFVPVMLVLAAACDRLESPPQPEMLAQSSRAAGARESYAAAPPRVPEPQRPSRTPPPAEMTDAAISARIGNALAADPGMAGADVSIHTDKGVVVLSGTVLSHEQTGIASGHAQRQDGVLRVDNHLRPTLS
jgi:hypothetical protein